MTLKFNELVFIRSDNPEAPANEWEPVPPEDVPSDLKDPEILGMMVAMPGYMASPRGDHETYYMVLKVPLDSTSH